MANILFILSSSSPFGGSTKSIESILEEFSKNKNTSFGIVLPNKTGVYNSWQTKGWTVHHVNLRHANFPPVKSAKDIISFPFKLLYHLIINQLAYLKIKNIIKKYKYELVHTNVGVINVGYKAAMKLGIKHIFHLREYQDLDFGERIYPSHTGFNNMLKKQIIIQLPSLRIYLITLIAITRKQKLSIMG